MLCDMRSIHSKQATAGSRDTYLKIVFDKLPATGYNSGIENERIETR